MILICRPCMTRRRWSDDARCLRRRSEEHTSELQSHSDLVCRLLLEKKTNDMIKSNDGMSQSVQPCNTQPARINIHVHSNLLSSYTAISSYRHSFTATITFQLRASYK